MVAVAAPGDAPVVVALVVALAVGDARVVADAERDRDAGVERRDGDGPPRSHDDRHPNADTDADAGTDAARVVAVVVAVAADYTAIMVAVVVAVAVGDWPLAMPRWLRRVLELNLG
jgi:hypothetical protein